MQQRRKRLFQLICYQEEGWCDNDLRRTRTKSSSIFVCRARACRQIKPISATREDGSPVPIFARRSKSTLDRCSNWMIGIRCNAMICTTSKQLDLSCRLQLTIPFASPAGVFKQRKCTTGPQRSERRRQAASTFGLIVDGADRSSWSRATLNLKP